MAIRMTRAYLEGFTEGRFGNLGNLRCPHARTSSVNEWHEGVDRGTVLRHFSDGTIPANADYKAELLKIRSLRGDVK